MDFGDVDDGFDILPQDQGKPQQGGLPEQGSKGKLKPVPKADEDDEFDDLDGDADFDDLDDLDF